MKYVVLVSRLLLGLAFFVFGLNDILMFMKPKADQLPTGDAGTMSTILMNSHWMTFVGCIMVVSGLLFLVGRFVPLAITLAAPVLVNILLFHLLLTQGHGIVPGAILTVLEVVLLLAYWRSFMPLLQPDPKFDTTKL
jgi:uncharacterized membrane protein YphA (DoxX/SURF4 family)